MFKRIWRTMKEAWVWMTSKAVLEAINNGATYDEVLGIINVEVGKK